ncbi:unnamed protein product [Soboliphyme baturini]|uniref:HTH_7 domain-containing protein n=1 Tax=Soboliphyme baturini TaxID=241478 RepID=A0A183III1_9BILA|nr:unnamed protein product [Soboliphyme baturini]
MNCQAISRYNTLKEKRKQGKQAKATMTPIGERIRNAIKIVRASHDAGTPSTHVLIDVCKEIEMIKVDLGGKCEM